MLHFFHLSNLMPSILDIVKRIVQDKVWIFKVEKLNPLAQPTINI
jgi:hypothetical protein